MTLILAIDYKLFHRKENIDILIHKNDKYFNFCRTPKY